MVGYDAGQNTLRPLWGFGQGISEQHNGPESFVERDTSRQRYWLVIGVTQPNLGFTDWYYREWPEWDATLARTLTYCVHSGLRTRIITQWARGFVEHCGTLLHRYWLGNLHFIFISNTLRPNWLFLPACRNAEPREWQVVMFRSTVKPFSIEFWASTRLHIVRSMCSRDKKNERSPQSRNNSNKNFARKQKIL